MLVHFCCWDCWWEVAISSQSRIATGMLLAVAVSTELLQLLTPDRDARLADAAIKSLSAMTGLFAGRTLRLIAERRKLNDN